MTFHIEYPRTVPARRPEGHVPAAPRYSLRWNKPVPILTSDYFALQGRDLLWAEQRKFFDLARDAFNGTDGAECWEIMRHTDESGYCNAIIVGYWTDAVRHARWCLNNPLTNWFADGARTQEQRGCWRETLQVPYDRHETIYSSPNYRIGFGLTADTEVVSITTNGYFGAARDRLPVSAIDTLESPFSENPPAELHEVQSFGKRLHVRAPLNMTSLRSGQYWAHAQQEQLDDYENNMRPRLMAGMGYLSENKRASGTLALRVMTNLGPDGEELKETSVLGHFVSLDHLEAWASSHATHHVIYHHAIAMNRKHKEEREFVSWHELFVPISSEFEDVNCHAGTGLLPFIPAIWP